MADANLPNQRLLFQAVCCLFLHSCVGLESKRLTQTLRGVTAV
jgi:hypothetical protein